MGHQRAWHDEYDNDLEAGLHVPVPTPDGRMVVRKLIAMANSFLLQCLITRATYELTIADLRKDPNWDAEYEARLCGSAIQGKVAS